MTGSEVPANGTVFHIKERSIGKIGNGSGAGVAGCDGLVMSGQIQVVRDSF
ncbi:MAG: hypothetical protein P8N72_18010 [Flavimaricola sp.]|nr:hypothetical protein [Flavimaricola sp.]